MKPYRVYCGMLDWYVNVEADTEEEAIRLGKKKVFSRLDNDASWWATDPKAPPSTGEELPK